MAALFCLFNNRNAMSYEVEKFTKPIHVEVDRCASPEGQNVTATLTSDFAARCAFKIFNGGWLSEDEIADIIRTERETETAQ